MKKKLGNILLMLGTIGMAIYLFEHLSFALFMLAVLHFAFTVMLIYTVAAGFGEVNKRIDTFHASANEKCETDKKEEEV